MANRCLNKVMLIGNLTRDPELRYTPNGIAVCSFGLATNRRWTTKDGEQKDDAQFHRIVAWNRLAELCSQLLVKGRHIYVEGRIQYREWTGSDGVKRQTTEIIISDMIILDSKPQEGVVPSDSEAKAAPLAEEETVKTEAVEPELEPESKADAGEEKAADKETSAEKPAEVGEAGEDNEKTGTDDEVKEKKEMPF